MRVRVRDGTEIPMIFKDAGMNQLWIGGTNKAELKYLGIEVHDCKRINMVSWVYLVDTKIYEDYITKNNLPELWFTL